MAENGRGFRRIEDRPERPSQANRRRSHDVLRSFPVWLALSGMMALSGCSRPIDAYDGAPLADSEVATVRGGGFPNLRAVDEIAIDPDPIVGPPDARIPAGRHTLVIDYQPCSNANSCGLAAATVEVTLQPGRVYEIRHVKESCSFWDALSSFTRTHQTPCRNYLWIEDHASGETIWGQGPVAVAD
jgi:hypothetical protein